MPILDTLSSTSITANEKIKELEKRYSDAPKTDELESQWDVKKHAIYTNKEKFPNPTKKVKDSDGNTKTKTLDLTRIGLAYQKKIVRTGVTFYCGNPITYNGDEDSSIFQSFKEVLKAVKSEFIDAETREAYGRWTECAEYWYTVDTGEKKDRYGFKSKFKIRCNVLTPDKYQMFPIFDKNQDLICFSFKYKSGDKDRMDVFTKDNIYKFVKDVNWEQESKNKNPFGLIPIDFIREPDGKPEYYDVQDAIERLEYIYSSLGESNNDFAFPILALYGDVTGAFSQKQGGRVLKFDNDSKGAQYVTPNDSTNGIESEKKTLERDVHDFTDTPDISLSNMEGLGNILSGKAAEFLFLAAHQKVVRNNRVFEPALKRRISIISAILKSMNGSFNEELEAEAEVHPFSVKYLKDEIDTYLGTLNGKQLFSLKYVLQSIGIDDPDNMIAEIQQEKEQLQPEEKEE